MPKPSNFNEGLRWLFAISGIAFGIAVGVSLVILVGIFVWGNWPAQFYGQILTILGWIAIGALSLLAITQIGQLLGGPVGRFKGSVSLKDGVSFDADGDKPDTQTTVTVETKGKSA